MPHSVDDSEAALKALGWSCGDLHCRTQSRRVFWMVLARRAEHRIVVRAETQAEAWTAAADQARALC